MTAGWWAKLLMSIAAVMVTMPLIVPVAVAQGQGPRCFGAAITLVAEPGQVTIGTAGDDVILGTVGADDIRGRGGDDRICALGGDDSVDGGAGNDMIALGPGADTALGRGGDDLIQGGRGADELVGNRGRDRLRGGKGPDTLRGSRARDQLNGQRGRDRCFGGPGRDGVRRCNEVDTGGVFPMPAVCALPPATWRDGQHPDSAPLTGSGEVWRAQRADVDGDGRMDRLRTVSCTFGGNVALLDVYAHDADGAYLGRVPVEEHALASTQGILPELLGSDDGIVQVRVASYRDGDGACCPSLSVRLGYRWSGSDFALVEIDGAAVA